MYTIDPALPVLLRPDGTVQVGLDPRHAVVVRPPSGLTCAGLAAVFKAMPAARSALHRLARRQGLTDPAALDAVLEALIGRGLVRPLVRGSGRALSIRVHGGGPLSDLLASGLRCSGARVCHTSHGNVAGAAVGVDLVVLADTLAADPRLVRELHAAGVPHFPVRVRDGTGVVGPLVLPGLSSCLTCADLHRTDRDPAWPALAAQLRELIGTADQPTLLATAALALGQLQQVIAGVRERTSATGLPVAAPATLNATVEVDVATHTIMARRWVRHPLCGCWPGTTS